MVIVDYFTPSERRTIVFHHIRSLLNAIFSLFLYHRPNVIAKTVVSRIKNHYLSAQLVMVENKEVATLADELPLTVSPRVSSCTLMHTHTLHVHALHVCACVHVCIECMCLCVRVCVCVQG